MSVGDDSESSDSTSNGDCDGEFDEDCLFLKSFHPIEIDDLSHEDEDFGWLGAASTSDARPLGANPSTLATAVGVPSEIVSIGCSIPSVAAAPSFSNQGLVNPPLPPAKASTFYTGGYNNPSNNYNNGMGCLPSHLVLPLSAPSSLWFPAAAPKSVIYCPP